MPGNCVIKLIKNKADECEECIGLFSCGIKLTDEERMDQEHNTQFLNLRDKSSLIYPKMSMVTLCRIVVTTFQEIMNNEKTMARL